MIDGDILDLTRLGYTCTVLPNTFTIIYWDMDSTFDLTNEVIL